MNILETDRLLLRLFEHSDLDDFYAYAKNPHVGPAAGWKPHDNKAESALILQDFVKEKEVLAIVEKASEKVIGSIALQLDDKRNHLCSRRLGYALAQEEWGKGYATEAVKSILQFGFNALDLELIAVNHFPSNNRSKRVIEKSGFVYEGVLRKATEVWTGQLLDNVCYSLTKEEYKKIPQ